VAYLSSLWAPCRVSGGLFFTKLCYSVGVSEQQAKTAILEEAGPDAVLRDMKLMTYNEAKAAYGLPYQLDSETDFSQLPVYAAILERTVWPDQEQEFLIVLYSHDGSVAAFVPRPKGAD